jgi:hypothetical protein
VAARAQQPERMRPIGVLMPLSADDPIAQARNAAFLQGLQQLGWTAGRNMEIDVRLAARATAAVVTPSARSGRTPQLKRDLLCDTPE